MRKKTRHLTMFLIKDSVQDYNEALKEPAILGRYDFKTELPFEGALYLRLPRNKNPWWVDFVQSGISNQIDELKNVSTAAVIFIKAESRIFALAFGYGRHLLKSTHSR